MMKIKGITTSAFILMSLVSHNAMAKQYRWFDLKKNGITKVYQHCNYGGYGVNLPEGKWNLHDLERMGIRNDDLSSIKVKDGYEVVMYKHNNFMGKSRRFTANDACLDDNNINDQVSSIIVRKKNRSYNQKDYGIAHWDKDNNYVNKVTVYQDCNYGGKAVEIPEGKWNKFDLMLMGVRNDALSSLRVPRGYEVTLYEHKRFKGQSRRFVASDECLVNDGFNDMATSIVVRKKHGWIDNKYHQSTGKVKFGKRIHGVKGGRNVAKLASFYEHCGYRGRRVELPMGKWNLFDLTQMGIGNDEISSLQVPVGYRVTVYEHVDFKGRSKHFTHNDSCLVNDNFNDKISSIKIQRDW